MQGKSRFDATREASRLRLRPILMTSFAFIFGVMPLMIASGAGAEMRKSLGTAVFSGMLGVTIFGIYLTPVFFYIIQGLSESSLFQSWPFRTALSYLVGGGLGAATGELLSRLDFGLDRTWDPIIGCAAGLLVIYGIFGLHTRITTRTGKPMWQRTPATKTDAASPEGEVKT
jgi:multidrug efflux pump